MALLLVPAIVLIPTTRETVAGWLGVPGIQIQFRTTMSRPRRRFRAQPSLGLLLGEPVTLEEARLRVDFAIAIPEASRTRHARRDLHPYLRPAAIRSSILYGARPGFPATAETGIGLLFIQFEALDDAFWGVKQYRQQRRQGRKRQ